MLTAGLSDATVIMPSSCAGEDDVTVIRSSAGASKRDVITPIHDWPVKSESDAPVNKVVPGKRSLLIIVAALIVFLTVLVAGYYVWKPDGQGNPDPIDIDIPEDLVSSALIYAKTASWHYSRGEKFKALIEEIKGLPSTSERTRFIADQEIRLNEAGKGFEQNFSQYSNSVTKLRRYPVESINQATQYFLQSPDYKNDRVYNLIAEVMTDHATGGTMNTEDWKNDLINISVKSDVFD